MSILSDPNKILLQIDYVLSKQAAQQLPNVEIEREAPLVGPEAEKFKFEDKPVSEQAGESPTGKVRTKIYELVHRGGRTFERARTAWVNPDVAKNLEQRKRASDWIRTLGNYLPIYFVGGYVRDKFFKKISKDIDLVTLTSLDEAKNILNSINIPFKESHNSHARLKFEVGGMNVDLISTTPDELLNNLRNRDFTINAIAQSVTGQFYDPTRGMEDIKLKWLRSPNNDSNKSFKADPIRILRAARFLADFPIKPHGTLLKGLKETSDVLSKSKKHRIGLELFKILQTEKPWIAMQFLADNGQLKHIAADLAKEIGFKQIGSERKHTDVWQHTVAALKNANSDDAILNLAILCHDIGKPQTATEKNRHFPGHDKKGSEITTALLKDLGYSQDLVKRISNMVLHHLFLTKVGLEGTDEQYQKVVLTLGGDIDRFFKLMKADGEDHKVRDEALLDKVEKRMRRIKADKPEQAGKKTLSKSQSVNLLDFSIDILLQDESTQDEGRQYDPEGFHVGPRHGKYFKPGEREAGGKEVEIVQAPEAAPEEDKWAAWRKKTEGFIQGLLDPESGTGFFGSFKTKQVRIPWEDDNRKQDPNGHVKRVMISGKQHALLFDNLEKLYKSKYRKNHMPVGPGGGGYKQRAGFDGSLFGGDERQKFRLEQFPNGAANLELWDGTRQEAGVGKKAQEAEQVKEQARDEDPLTDHFGGEVPQVLIQNWMTDFMKVPGRVPDAGTIVEMGKYLASKQTKTIPKEFATRLGDLSQYLDIEKSQAVAYLEEMLELVGDNA